MLAPVESRAKVTQKLRFLEDRWGDQTVAKQDSNAGGVVGVPGRIYLGSAFEELQNFWQQGCGVATSSAEIDPIDRSKKNVLWIKGKW